MKRLALASLSAFAILACQSDQPASPSSGEVVFAISDGAHDGNARFYFLPPLVPPPSFTGTFDETASPVVGICLWDGAECGVSIATFDVTTGPGSETVRMVLAEEHYIVNWHTDQTAVPGQTYRIDVSVGGTSLGFADVVVADNGREAKNLKTDETFGLKDGRTLPIKFRIEKDEDGPVFVIGPGGGEIRAFGGAVTLVIREDALTEDVAITVTQVSDLPADVGLIDGTLFDFAPDGTVFTVPVELTIEYDETKLPDGMDESSLTLLSEEGGGARGETAAKTAVGAVGEGLVPWPEPGVESGSSACGTAELRKTVPPPHGAGVLGTADQLPSDRLRTLPNRVLIVPRIARNPTAQ